MGIRPDEILTESFRIIDAEVGAHRFGEFETIDLRHLHIEKNQIDVAFEAIPSAHKF